MDYQAMGKTIRALRKNKRLTQEELAEKLEISASFYGHIERGTRVASLETLVKICNVLQVSPSYLLSASLDVSSFDEPAKMTGAEKAKILYLLKLALATLGTTDI